MDDGTGLYGKGALISDYDAEKLRAEKPKTKVTLSERERELINSLNESYTMEGRS